MRGKGFELGMETKDELERKQPESSKDKMFTKEMLAFFGSVAIEDVRTMPYQFDRIGFQDGEEDAESGEFKERRCKFCHQPIKYPIRIQTASNLAIIGSDCARKLVQFQETGEVMSVTQTLRGEAQAFKKAFDTLVAADENTVLGREEHTRKRNALFASMITWSRQRAASDSENMPQSVKRALQEIDIFGAPLGLDGAQNFLTWYVETRTLNSEGILTEEEKELFATHPHKEMLQKILRDSPQKNIHDSQRIVRIVRHYKEPIDISREIMDALIEKGVVFVNPRAQGVRAEIYQGNAGKKEMIYTALTKIFNGRFPQEHALQNPEFASSPVRRGYENSADIYAYEKTTENRLLIEAAPPIDSSWAKGSQFLDISKAWLGRDIYRGTLHRCYTVAVTKYGRIKIMKGEEVVSQDIVEYLKERGVDISIRAEGEKE